MKRRTTQSADPVAADVSRLKLGGQRGLTSAATDAPQPAQGAPVYSITWPSFNNCARNATSGTSCTAMP